jgi:hypothetical protein
MSILRFVVTFLGSLFKSRRQLVLENLALKQQVAMLRQSVKRPTATAAATARLLPRACYRAPATARLARPGRTRMSNVLSAPSAGIVWII